jgi:hypothetical protein
MRPYLSICAIYRDESPYLREWVEFHRLVGVERFFLYNNLSEDDHRDVLAPYVREGLVLVHEWPHYPAQLQAYDDCLKAHRHDSRWIAFIDLDEFLFSSTLEPVPAILRDYEKHPGVVVNWVMFGTSGHVTKPPGLVIENYLRRKDYSNVMEEHVKCVVDPVRTTGPGVSAHWFRYQEGYAVNEEYRPQDQMPFSFAPTAFSRLRVNHYARKSEEEYQRKIGRGMAHSGELKRKPPETYEQRNRVLNAVYDDAITAYLPALREALARLDTTAGGEDRNHLS